MLYQGAINLPVSCYPVLEYGSQIKLGILKLSLGDIGKLYPDSDDKFLNINSRILLKDVAKRMTEAGYIIGNVDATVIAQSPKLSPYIDQMRKNIAEDLSTNEQNVNVKATTEEHLGFTGRGEGISAHAVCIIVKK